jgi:threonine/homoserine/homoserine lactone efflux protein
VAGLCSGLLFHTAAVALGLAALLAASAHAFTVLKLCGAAYLLWLAWGAWHTPATLVQGDDSAPMSGIQTYVRGVIMNVTNPKVAIFFLAFLPQFVDPEQGGVPVQIMGLGAIFMLATFLTFSTIAWFAASFGESLRDSAKAQRLLNRAAALVFAGLALKLALAQR